ncbi:diadenylate cyclase CdaA [Lachnospiraceae bacterium OttesenSCG-928-D06]|nr:diadenylate cyclase CdaA [Lachnospiraceae bacterium OttesenSCG-928-D06]
MDWVDRIYKWAIARMPAMQIGDVAEILIIAFLIYHIMLWIKNSRAWSLLKGFMVIAALLLLAFLFEMNTILWIASNVFSVALIAIVIILQPELRRALEDLGKKNIIRSVLPIDITRNKDSELFSDRTINEIVKASVEMGKVKTGALIVIEQTNNLSDYERTGIDVDAIVSSQLLINIFEHNTPLHDGAIIVRGNRITSATCYLPLSDNMNLNKELGTRHRAAIGISEATDSFTVIVSEETGSISVAYNGKIERNLDGEALKARLSGIQNKNTEEPKRKRKGRSKVAT